MKKKFNNNQELFFNTPIKRFRSDYHQHYDWLVRLSTRQINQKKVL